MVNEYRDYRNTRATTAFDISDVTAVQHSSINWRAIFAGTFVSLLVYSTLMALGVAIAGATLVGVINAEEGGTALSIGSGVWLIVSALVSLFVGSYLAGRVGGLIHTRIGTVQGLVISSLFFAFLLSQVGAGIGGLGRGVGSTIGALGGAAGDLSKNPQVQDTIERSLGDLNLKSPPDQVIQGVATRLLRGDETGARDYLARQAGLSPTEAQQRIDTFKNDFQNTAKDVGATAARVVSVAGWTLFGSLLLGSLFAALGGGAGARRNLNRPLGQKDEEVIDRKAA
ncbi:MAG: hypothetical protein AB1540_01695 [Bdellovibrionota bacterium]